MVFSSIGLAVFNVIYILTLKVIFNDNFIDAIFILPGIAFNGFLSGILVLGLLTPLEAILNTASVFRLMDLSDHQNTPMLRKLFLTAPGTYQHSLMVGQLAESACNKIGANARLDELEKDYKYEKLTCPHLETWFHKTALHSVKEENKVGYDNCGK